MYGGEAADYLPDVEINSAIVDIYRVFCDMSTQWRYAGVQGAVTGLDYAALPFVLSCHGLENSGQTLRDIRVMESAALPCINQKE